MVTLIISLENSDPLKARRQFIKLATQFLAFLAHAELQRTGRDEYSLLIGPLTAPGAVDYLNALAEALSVRIVCEVREA